MTTAAAIAHEADSRLREKTDPERQAFTEGYFPSAMENLGVAVPHIRKVVRDLKVRLKQDEAGFVVDVARAVLRSNTLEGSQVAYFLLNQHPAALASLRVRTLEELGRTMDNWVSVDTFGCYVAGPAWREGQITDSALTRWARSKNRWWRRAAIVSTVALNLPSRGGSGDVERTVALAAKLVDDHDDMVVKGLSWALRSLVAVDAAAVRGFLDQHDGALHKRVVREVSNKLDTGLKTPKNARRKKA